jgi:hypothetical protein
MAFSKNPALATYKKEMINLFKEQSNRGVTATKDEDYINVFLELVKNKEVKDEDVHIVKRSGSTGYIDAVAGAEVRGMHYNEDFRKLYYVVGSTLYIWSVAGGSLSATEAAFFGTTMGDVGFCDYLYDNGMQVVIATDGTTLKQIESDNTVTANADGDMPTHLPKPVFLDGYLFIIKTGTSDIYNSNLNNPLAWTPGDFITAEISPDLIRSIAKLNNYILVFSSSSIEYFWDAAVETGSPLQRNDTPVKFNGYLGGLARHGTKLYFVGNSVDGFPEVFAVEDFKIEKLSTESLSRYLTDLTTTYSTIKGSIVGMQGHTFYVLNAGSSTYIMDLETKLWTRWTYQDTSSFPIDFCVNAKTLSGYFCIFVRSDTTEIERFDTDLYQDNGEDFSCSGVTDNEYFESYNQKSMFRLTVWADKPNSSGDLSIQWTDDDYQTFSDAVTVDLYQERPSINRLGRFRRRAFKWTFTENLPFRLRGLEVDINKGQS